MFFRKVILASVMALAPVSVQALTVTQSSGLSFGPFSIRIADVIADSAGVTYAFDDSDFFIDEDPTSTISPFLFYLQPKTGGSTQLRVQTDVCEDGSCGFRGIRPGSNFGFAIYGEDFGPVINQRIFPGDIDVDEVLNIPDLEPRSGGMLFGQGFEVIFLDPFANGDQLPTFSLTFTYVPEDASVTVVPLPASGLLLVGAFGGLARIRRKRK